MARIQQFNREAESWSAEGFARWLLSGLEGWYEPGERQTEAGFHPAIFDLHTAVRDQISDAVAHLAPRARAAFRDGIVQAIDGWTVNMRQQVLRDLLWLAEAQVPIGLPRKLFQLFVAGPLGSDKIADRTRVRIFNALCAYETAEARELLARIKGSPNWSLRLAPRYLRAVAKSSTNGEWLEHFRSLKADFLELRRSQSDLKTAFGLFVDDFGGIENFLGELHRLDYREDDWINDVLFDEEDGIVALEPTSDGGWKASFGEAQILVSEVLPEKAYKTFLKWVTHHPDYITQQPMDDVVVKFEEARKKWKSLGRPPVADKKMPRRLRYAR